MGIGSVNASFTFAELESKVNGRFNRGELRLDAEGKIHRANNHVWLQVFNRKATNEQENLNVRTAVFDVIAREFSNAKGTSPYLQIAQEFLLGEENAVKPLSRDEVRGVIAQLKAVAKSVVSDAEGKLSQARISLSYAMGEKESLEGITLDLEQEVLPVDVADKQKEVDALKQKLDGLGAERKDLETEYGKLVEELFGSKTEIPEAEQEAASSIKDLADEIFRMRRSLGGLKSKTNNDASAIEKEIKDAETAIDERFNELGKDPKQVDRFKALVKTIGGKEQNIGRTGLELEEESKKLAAWSGRVKDKQKVDELVSRNKTLESQIRRADPTQVGALRKELSTNRKDIEILRERRGLNDGREGGMLTQKDVDRLDKRKADSLKAVDKAEAAVKAAEANLAKAKASVLSLGEFKNLLRTIRAVKENSAEVIREADGKFRLVGSSRGFDRKTVLSGLGKHRDEILYQRTDNTAQALRNQESGNVNRPQELTDRASAFSAFKGRAVKLLGGLAEDFKSAIADLHGKYADQCQKARDLILEKLNAVIEQSGAIPGLGDSLRRDVEALKGKLDEALVEAKMHEDKTGNRSDYRGFFKIAADRLDPFCELYDRTGEPVESVSVIEARELICRSFREILSLSRIEPAPRKLEAQEISGSSKTMLAKVDERVKNDPVLGSVVTCCLLPFNEVAASAADVLTQVFGEMSGIDAKALAKDLVDEVRRGNLMPDKFIDRFVERVRGDSAYPPAGPGRNALEEQLESLSESMIGLERLFMPDSPDRPDLLDTIRNQLELKMIDNEPGGYTPTSGSFEQARVIADSLEQLFRDNGAEDGFPIADIRASLESFRLGEQTFGEFSDHVLAAINTLPTDLAVAIADVLRFDLGE